MTLDTLIESLGFAVRPYPLPARLLGTAYALVPAEHRTPRLEPSGAAVPLLALTASQDPETALRRLAARAAQLRLGGETYGIGAAASADAAAHDARHDALERRTPPATARRLTAWSDTVRSPLHPAWDVRLDCHLYGDGRDGLAPWVGAVLRRNDREIRAFGCDTTVRGAIGRALDGVLTLAAEDRWSAPGKDPEFVGEVEGVPEGEWDEPVGAEMRTVHSGAGGTVVQCRLPGVAPRQEPVGRFAPVDLSLGCDPERVRISRTFHENSKIRSAFRTLPPVDVDRLTPDTRRALTRPYRDYGRTRTEQPWPVEGARPLLPLDTAVRHRRSAAPMSRAPMQLADLARVLELSVGVTGIARAPDGVELPLRATPSAGGLCSYDLFVLARNVEGLAPGVHYVHPGRRVLQLVDGERPFEDMAAHTGYSGRVAEAAAVVVFVAAFRRGRWKYGERGYRMALIECGHVAQSVVTAAAALGLVAHPLAGFVDDYFDRLVGVNGTDDAVVHLTLLGEARA
ncbi:SagB/ThcOx family dehydrogenase [Streptomyces sp. NPDC021093]|uniref:SagB/ThcOx family dehydrogenase n=1 Tax=Streptomyces sp. NPDC021093 TaxID=3365112 RepID=UPI0037B60E6D